MNFIIRHAVPEDSEQLIQLASLTPMNGAIGLRIERNPDFFKLLDLSESFIALVAENNMKQLTGCFAATKSYLSIGDEKSVVYYLRDLKIHPRYKGTLLAYLLVKKMYEILMERGADILCCTMALGNDAVVPFFKGRAGIPAFTEVAKYNIYQALPKHNSKFSNCEKLTNTTIIADFFNTGFKRFSIRPYKICAGELSNCVNFSIAGKKNTEAAIAAFDPSPYKQNIVTRYSFSIAILLGMLGFLKLFFKLPFLPEKNVPLRMIYAKYYGCIENKEAYLKSLIQQLRHYAFEKKYHLVAIAADEKDTIMNKMLKPLSSFVFRSTLLATSLQKNEEALNKMKQGICYEDYSLV